MSKNKKIAVCIIAAVLILVIALVAVNVKRARSTQMELLSSGQVEYYKSVYEKFYELRISTEEFLEYCVETDREQVNEDRLMINYDCTLESFEGILPACSELRYVNVSKEGTFPDMLRISYLADDGNEVLVCYADDMIWEWMVYDAAEDELISITELKWVKYTNYKNGRN